MSFASRFEQLFRSVLPSPFALAVALTFLVLLTALIGFIPEGSSFGTHANHTLEDWYKGLWDGPMLVFAFQMMLILVLGHVLALSAPAERFMNLASGGIRSTAGAAALVCVVCVVLGLINWGLALIFGAIFARKIAESARRRGIAINYPLVAAAGYTGMMVWHGGLSGSALIKVAEPGHIHALMDGTELLDSGVLPAELGLGHTLLSPMNLTVSIALLIALPVLAYAVGKRVKPTAIHLKPMDIAAPPAKPAGMAEKTDVHPVPSWLLALLCLAAAAVVAVNHVRSGDTNFVGPDYINLLFLGLGLMAHGSLQRFGSALEAAIVGASGILIQFPLYFGIMAVLKTSGMGAAISDFFVSIASPATYPVLTFFSAGFVNILVPSGGGQWMVQGPIIIEASQKMGLSLPQSILAMAYGDQITNMLQPFWALPLLSITGLKARDILPYTLYFMLAGIAIFIVALLLF